MTEFVYCFFQVLEENILSFVKDELNKIQRFLNSECSDDEVIRSKEDKDLTGTREAFLKIALYFLRRINQVELANSLQSSKMIFQLLHRAKGNKWRNEKKAEFQVVINSYVIYI